MNTRSLPNVLAGIATALCVAELISTVQLWARGGADSYPWFALGFAVLFALGAWLLPDRTGGDRFGPGRGARDLRGRRLSRSGPSTARSTGSSTPRSPSWRCSASASRSPSWSPAPRARGPPSRRTCERLTPGR